MAIMKKYLDFGSNSITHQHDFSGKMRLLWRLAFLMLRAILNRRHGISKYLSDIRKFTEAGGKITHIFPVLNEYKDQAGTATGHYFHQDLLVASLIHDKNPLRHIDVGSRIDGFVAHVAAFRLIDVLDYRSLVNCGHARIKFMQADMMSLDSKFYEITDSLSCLHALEHFGLGRYGDPINPTGHITGFKNLHKMLKLGGYLYISFPIGQHSVHFNAHRIFNPKEILDWSIGLFTVERFDFVDDQGDLHKNQSIDHVPNLDYGCGIYTLKKISN
jgi:hypothetical protein